MCARAAFEGGRNEISPPPPSGKNNYACVRGFLCSPVIFEFPPFFFSHNHRVNSIKTELRRRQRRNARGQNYSKCRPTRTVHSSKTKIYITDRSPAGPLLPGVPWSGSMRGCCCCFRCRCRRGSRCCSRSEPWKHKKRMSYANIGYQEHHVQDVSKQIFRAPLPHATPKGDHPHDITTQNNKKRQNLFAFRVREERRIFAQKILVSFDRRIFHFQAERARNSQKKCAYILRRPATAKSAPNAHGEKNVYQEERTDRRPKSFFFSPFWQIAIVFRSGGGGEEGGGIGHKCMKREEEGQEKDLKRQATQGSAQAHERQIINLI